MKAVTYNLVPDEMTNTVYDLCSEDSILHVVELEWAELKKLCPNISKTKPNVKVTLTYKENK